METILVGYDATDEAKAALDQAVSLTKRFDAKLVVVSVATLLQGGGRSMGDIDPLETPGAHQEMLDEVLARLGSEGVRAEGQLAVGYVSDAIVAAADEVGADLIVVGSRDLNFFERWLGGSISDGVVHKASCDVLIVHRR